MYLDLSATKSHFTKGLEKGTRINRSAVKVVDKLGCLFLNATEACIKRDKVKGEDISKALEKVGLANYGKIAKQTADKADEKMKAWKTVKNDEDETSLLCICLGCKQTIPECTCEDEEI